MNDSSLVSVLVLTRNRPHIIADCLASIEKQKYHNYEIVLLDDASDAGKGLADFGFESRGNIRVLRNQQSLGVAGGRNELIEQARGEYLIFLDDDATFKTDNAIDLVVAAFEAQDSLSAIAFHIELITHEGQMGYQLPFSKKTLVKNRALQHSNVKVSYYVGAGHALRKSMLKEVGLYQSDLVYGGEELDLAYRLILHGYSIIYLHEVLVEHRPLPSVVNQRRVGELFYTTRNRVWLGFRYIPQPYLWVYLCFWSVFQGVLGLFKQNIAEYFKGLWAGAIGVRHLERTPMNSAARRYLLENYGRLWY